MKKEKEKDRGKQIRVYKNVLKIKSVLGVSVYLMKERAISKTKIDYRTRGSKLLLICFAVVPPREAKGSYLLPGYKFIIIIIIIIIFLIVDVFLPPNAQITQPICPNFIRVQNGGGERLPPSSSAYTYPIAETVWQ